MSEETEKYAVQKPGPHDFVAFVPYACAQLQAAFELHIQLIHIEESTIKGSKSKRAVQRDGSTGRQRPVSNEALSSHGAVSPHAVGLRTVVLTAVCDPAGRLVELLFHRCVQLPTLLLRVIALCLPYQPALARVSVRWGPPRSRCVHELASMLPQSNITELCLDDSPALERNYHALLEGPTQLRSLSLARCALGDEDCALLAARLRLPAPAARSLAALSLVCNAVSDVGAAALGEALRTNRALRHLNLAGNRITDAGAASLLRSLAAFPLRPDEVAAKRQRVIDHIKRQMVVDAKCLNEHAAPGERSERGPLGAKAKAAARSRSAPKADADSTPAAPAVPPEPPEPFGAEHTLWLASGAHCVGNLALSYLNLAYNNLQLTSASLLLRVLRAQAGARERAGAAGLLHVQLAGNLLPAKCAELELAGELLASALGEGLKLSKHDRSRKK